MSLLRNTDPNQENGETKPKSVKKDVNVTEMFQKIGAKLGWFEFKDLDSALKTLSGSSKKKGSKSRRRREYSDDSQDNSSERPRRMIGRSTKSGHQKTKSKISFSSESPSPLKEIQNSNIETALLTDSDPEIPLRTTQASTDLTKKTKNHTKSINKENNSLFEGVKKLQGANNSGKTNFKQPYRCSSSSNESDNYDFGAPVQESTRIHSRDSIDTILDTPENTLNQFDSSKDDSFKQLDIQKKSSKKQVTVGSFPQVSLVYKQQQNNTDLSSKLDISDNVFENTTSSHMCTTAALDNLSDTTGCPKKVEKFRRSVYYDASADPEMSNELLNNLHKVEKSRKSVYFDARTGNSSSSGSSFTELSPPSRKSSDQRHGNAITGLQTSKSQSSKQFSDDCDLSSFEVVDISIQTDGIENESKENEKNSIPLHYRETEKNLPGKKSEDHGSDNEIDDFSLQTTIKLPSGNHDNFRCDCRLLKGDNSKNSIENYRNSDKMTEANESERVCNQLEGNTPRGSNSYCSDDSGSYVEVQDVSLQANDSLSINMESNPGPVSCQSSKKLVTKGGERDLKEHADSASTSDTHKEHSSTNQICLSLSSDEDVYQGTSEKDIEKVVQSITSSDDSDIDHDILDQEKHSEIMKLTTVSQRVEDILSSSEDESSVSTQASKKTGDCNDSAGKVLSYTSRSKLGKNLSFNKSEQSGWRKPKHYSDSSGDEEELESFFQKMRTKSQVEEEKQEDSDDGMENFIVDDLEVSISDFDSEEDEDEILINSEQICISSDDEFLTPAKTRHKRYTQSIEVLTSDTESSDDDLPELKETKPRRTPMKIPKVYKVSVRPAEITKTPNRAPVKETPKKPVDVCRQYSFLKSLSHGLPMERCDSVALRFVKNFAKMREELTVKLFKIYNETVFDNKLPVNLSITWNKRLLKTAGYCRYKKSRDTTSANVELSVKVCDSAERTRDTLIHELCHAAVWLLNGVNDGHGPYWKYWARKANKTHPELPVVSRCHSYKIETKYKYQCENCKYEIGRHSKSLNTERFVCGKCQRKFILLDKTGRPVHGATNKDGTAKTPNKFALFVKENYKEVKNRDKSLKHAEVMSVLSKEFAKQKLS